MTLRVGLEYQQSIGTHDVKYLSNESDKGSGLRDGELILPRVKNKNKENAHDRGKWTKPIGSYQFTGSLA